MSHRPWFWLCCLLFPADGLSAQAPADSARLPEPLRIPREREAALAKSAAPDAVADSAEIWVLGERGYEKVQDGSNGYGCFVQRALSGQSQIPRCDDASGMATLFPIYQMVETMRAAGSTYGEFRRALADAYSTGQLKEPRHGGLSYMYSVDAFFALPNGQRAPFTPHVMIYWPNCNLSLLGMSERAQMRGTGLSFIDYGTPECTLVINTPESTARRARDTHH